jgi:hypothetical protein
VRAERQVHVKVARRAHASSLFGRDTSSPLQFGQT